jgi:hypothetical protein
MSLTLESARVDLAMADRYFRSMFKSRTDGLLSRLAVTRENDRSVCNCLTIESTDAEADIADGFGAEALF